MSTDDDDFSYDCPKCKEMPAKGVFIGSLIWHTECLVEDTIENFNNGKLSEDSLKERMKSLDQSTKTKVEIGIGWKQPVKIKSPEELQKEFESSVENVEAVVFEEKEIESVESSVVENDSLNKNQNSSDTIKQPETTIETNSISIEENIAKHKTIEYVKDNSNLYSLAEKEFAKSLPMFRELALKNAEYAKLYSELMNSLVQLLKRN